MNHQANYNLSKHSVCSLQAILDLAEKKDLKGKAGMLDKMMDMGFHVDIRVRVCV